MKASFLVYAAPDHVVEHEWFENERSLAKLHLLLRRI